MSSCDAQISDRPPRLFQAYIRDYIEIFDRVTVLLEQHEGGHPSGRARALAAVSSANGHETNPKPDVKHNIAGAGK